MLTTEHVEIVESLVKRLSSPDVLAFLDFEAALSGDRPFRLITDASVDGLGAIIEQAQPDSSTRPLCFLSRTTLPNERNWSEVGMCCYCLGSKEKSTNVLWHFFCSSKRSPTTELGKFIDESKSSSTRV